MNKAFLVYGPNDATLDDGPRTVVYDPASPVQTQTSVDVSAFVGVEGFIWWKPEYADSDLRSEAHWVVPSGETFSPTETVNSEYVTFFVTDISGHPVVNFANGWRVLGHIRTWTGLDPAITMVHYLDSLLVMSRRLKAPTFSTYDYLNPPFDGYGLVYVMKRIVDQLWMFQDSTANINELGEVTSDPAIATSWYKRPKYGAEQVASNIDTLNVVARSGVLAIVPVRYITFTSTWSLVTTPGSIYAVDGFLAVPPNVSTVSGSLGYNACSITLAVNSGYVITSVASNINRHVPAGLPLANFPPENLPVGYAASRNPMPIDITFLSSQSFYVGCRFIDFSTFPWIKDYYTVAPESLSLVVYGYKKP